MYVLLIILIIVLLFFLWSWHRENFATKREKATRIVDWFHTNTAPNYATYRSDLNHRSNIVEYEVARGLHQEKRLNIDSLAAVL
jgi:hypothetical protein